MNELKSRGILEEKTIAQLRRESILSGKSAEAIINEKRLADDRTVAEAKADILKIPYYKLDAQKIDEALLALIPEDTARTYGVSPIEKKDDLLVVGMVYPDDTRAQEALKFIARRNRLNLGVYVISYADWQQVLRRYSPYKSEVAEAVRSLNLDTEKSKKLIDIEASSGSEDAPVIRIVADTLREAVQSEASDIHIEPEENYLRVRFRISGDLRESASLPLELAPSVISRIKVMSNLKIDEKRVPQDGRFRARIFDREIDFRVSTFPTPLGEKVAIRVLDPKTGIKTLSELGMNDYTRKIVEEGIEKPFGMVLISGPTGSGKTTTLYALLQILNKENVNIVSLEDPVEYFIPGVNQSQVRPEIGYDFASGLRQILRQDPDVIMVGEMRDDETAGLAVHAALTGHVVLSTVHTNNAASVIPRLTDMKVEAFLLPSALNIVLAQRLVPVLCDNCKKPSAPPETIKTIIKKALEGVPEEIALKFKEPYQVYRAEGCPVCKGKGITGRIALFEVFRMTAEIEEITLHSPTAQKILAQAKKDGMVTMRDDGVVKALEGLVSIEAVIRETEE